MTTLNGSALAGLASSASTAAVESMTFVSLELFPNAADPAEDRSAPARLNTTAETTSKFSSVLRASFENGQRGRIACALHDPTESPSGFGVRQSSGAFRLGPADSKTSGDCRKPKRSRTLGRFMAQRARLAMWSLAKKGFP